MSRPITDRIQKEFVGGSISVLWEIIRLSTAVWVRRIRRRQQRHTVLGREKKKNMKKSADVIQYFFKLNPACSCDRRQFAFIQTVMRCRGWFVDYVSWLILGVECSNNNICHRDWDWELNTAIALGWQHKVPEREKVWSVIGRHAWNKGAICLTFWVLHNLHHLFAALMKHLVGLWCPRAQGL